MKRMRARDVVAVVASLCLLAGAAVESASISAPPDASAYHARCREVAATIPATIGDWVGKDVAIPRDAVGLLRPNVAINREFTHSITGKKVSVFFVQCEDLRDIAPHYPPVCYPTSRGMEQVSAQPREWNVAGLNVTGTEYEFRFNNYVTGNAVTVQNFILSPQGEICRDMKPLQEQLPLRNRFYGAGQVQLVYDDDAAWSQAARDATLEELIGAYRPLIETVLKGSGRHETR
jgi:hypothetical protein